MQYSPQIEKVIENIAHRIFITHEFQPGDRLPNERQLAAELSVSRNTLREGINALKAKGVLRVIHGSGTYVNPYPGISEDPYSLKKHANCYRTMKILYEVRIAIEPEVAAIVSQRGSDKAIRDIIFYKNLCSELIQTGQDWSFADQEFHAAIAKASENPIFEQFIPSIHQSAYLGSLLLLPDDAKNNALFWHDQICSFIQSRDVEGSRLAMRAHLLTAQTRLAEMVSRSGLTEDDPF